MKKIPLNGARAGGRVALVDDADYELVSQYKWHASYTKSSGPYAATCSKVGGTWKTFRMHKLITGWPQTDHVNGDGLDNRRSNLRSATSSQNSANSRPTRGTSRFKGVSWSLTRSKWHAKICVNGKKLHLGYFASEPEAALAYRTAAIAAFGEYARFSDVSDA